MIATFCTFTKRLLSATIVTALIVTGYVVSAFAEQASFACSDAALVDEKLICSDPLLSHADYTLGQTYSDMMHNAEPARQEALRSDQHNWLLLRNRECGLSKQTQVTDDNRASYVDCMLAAYEERTADLEAIKAHPEKDPAEISTPIRKPQSALGNQPSPAVSDILQSNLLTNAAARPAWSKDGQLIALAKLRGDKDENLYAWKPGQTPKVLSKAITDPATIRSLCIRDNNVVLTRNDGSEFASLPLLGEAVELKWQQGAGNGCGGNTVTDTSGKTSVTLGPDRFINLQRDGKAIQLNPPLRIDRRFSLHAFYSPMVDSFVINADSRPETLRTETERRWAKSNCLPFWEVSAKSGDVTHQCIPYGAYVQDIPEPLPTKASLFFITGSGLYKITTGIAIQIMKGQMGSAVLSSDGCHLAYTGSPADGDGVSGPLQVVDVCKASSEETKK